MTTERRDIYGNAVDWKATGRRRVNAQGRLVAELIRDNSTIWALCRPAEGCDECEFPPVAHVCAVTP